MSKTIDERIVEMRFDNAQFENGINQSMNSLDKLKEALDFSNLSDNGINNFSKDISGIGASVDSIADRFTNLGVIGTTAMAKLTSSAIDLGMSLKEHLVHNMEEGYSKYNIMMESIQTIMYGTREQIGEGLKWADQEEQMDFVTSQIEKLNWYTDETSYNLTDMTNSIGKFVANGVDLEDATTAMMGISSWAAMSGQNAEAASRAMYNLSQALSIGKVTVADWKSIELANMATTEFKHTVVDLAYEMGKLHETEEGWYAAFDAKGKEVLVSYDGMRNSLSSGWFDNDVLTAVLKKYGDFADDLYDSVERTGLTATELLRYSDQYKKALADGKDMTKWMQDIVSKNNIGNYAAFSESLEKLTSEYNELGRQAFKAGQECKTFKDVMLYTEDAATSAWMGIYTAIFGNYLQSKELWTQMAEEMYFVAVESVEAKKNLLQRWNDIGGRDHLVNALWDVWYNIKDVLEALKDAFADVFPEKNAVQLLSYAVDFERIMQKLRFVDFPWAPQLTMIQQSAQNIAESVGHIVHFVTAIADSAYKAWQKIFAPKMSIGDQETEVIKTILSITEAIEKMTSVFEFSEEQSEKLERSFAGLFAIFDIFRMLLVSILEPFTGFELEVIDIKDPILDVTAAIGDWLVALRDWIKDHHVFTDAISTAIGFIKKIPGYIDEFLKKTFNLGLNDVWEMIKTGAYYAAGAVYLLFTNLPKYAEKATQLLFGMDLATFWQNLKVWICSVWDVAKQFFFGIATSSKKATKSLTVAGFTGFWVKLVQWVLDAKITIWDFFGGLPGKINLVSKLLFHTDLKSFWDKFKGWVGGIGDAVIKVFTNIIPEKANELSTFLFGSDLTTIWGTIKDYVVGVGVSIKDFFTGLPGKIGPKFEQFKMKVQDIGTTIKDFFLDIPNKLKELKAKFEQTKVYAIWTKMKEKAQEAWSSIKDFFSNFKERVDELSMKLFGSDLATWWNGLITNVVGAWFKMKDFFTQLPDKLNEATQKLFNSDFKTFWENTGDNIRGAWDAVTYFFTHLPEEANAATEALFQTDFHTWWEGVKQWFSDAKDNVVDFFEKLPGRILTLKDHIEELRHTIIKFFEEDIPSKLDEISNKIFQKDFAGVVKDVKDNVEKLKQAWKDFWGIGEEYEKPDEKPGMKHDENGTTQFLLDKKGTKYGQSGIDQVKKFIGNLTDSFSSLEDFKESDIGNVIKNLGRLAVAFGIIFGIAKIILNISKVIKAITGAKDLANAAKEGTKSSFWGDFLGGFLNPFKEVAEEAKKGTKNISKFVMIKMICDAILEVAAALAVLASLKPGRLWSAVGAVVVIIGLIAGLMFAVSSEKFGSKLNTKDLTAIGIFFDLLGGAMIEVAAALWIAGQVNPLNLLAAVDAILLLFGAIGGLMIFFTSGKMDFDPSKLKNLAWAMDIMALSLIEIAAALWIMKDISPESLEASTIALTLLIGVIFGLMVAVEKIGLTVPTMLAFGGAIALVGLGAALAGAGIWLICDGIEKLSNIGPEGIENMTNGLLAFSEVLPELATNVVNGLAAAAAAFSENKETFKQAGVDLIDIIMTCLEAGIPRLLNLVGDLITQMLDWIIENAPKIQQTIEAVLTLLFNILTGFIPTMTQFVLDMIVDTLERLYQNIGKITALVTAIVIETILGTIDGITMEIPHFIDSLWNFWITLINSFADGLDEHAQPLRDALEHLVTSAINFVKTLFGIKDDNGEGSAFSNIAANLMGGFANKIGSLVSTVTKKIQLFVDATIGKVLKLFGIEKLDGESNTNCFLRVAKNLIDGFIKGITEGVTNVTTAIQGFCDSVINTVTGKDGFDEHSPSKVSEKIGKFFDEGFAKGVRDNLFMTTDATEDLAQQAINGVSSAIATVSDVINDEMDTSPTIRPILDLSSVVDGANAIDGMLDGNRSMSMAVRSDGEFNRNLSGKFNTATAFESLRATLGGMANDRGTIVNNNTFYVTGDDPQAIAEEISHILQLDVDRRNAVWGT